MNKQKLKIKSEKQKGKVKRAQEHPRIYGNQMQTVKPKTEKTVKTKQTKQKAITEKLQKN